MAERRPICLVGGQMKELPPGDSLPGGGGPAALTAATTSGAAQVVDVSAADIHICDLDVSVVNLTFTASTPVARCAVHLKQSYDENFGVPSIPPVLEGLELGQPLTGVESYVYHLAMSPAKDRFYGSVLPLGECKIVQCDLGAVDSLSDGITFAGVSPDLSGVMGSNPSGLTMTADRSRIIVPCFDRKVYSFVLLTPGDVTTLDLGSVVVWDAHVDGYRPYGIKLLNGDTKLLMDDMNSKKWVMFDLPSAGDISAPAIDAGNEFDARTAVGISQSVVSFEFGASETEIYIAQNGYLHRVDLPSVATLSGATYVASSRLPLNIYFLIAESGGKILNGMSSSRFEPSHNVIGLKENVVLGLPGNLKKPDCAEPNFFQDQVWDVVTTDGGTTFTVVNVQEGVA